jgi:hypothetical protein
MKKPKPVAKPKSQDAVCAAALIIMESDPKAFLLQQNGHDGEEEFYLYPTGWKIERNYAYVLIASPAVVPGNAGLMIRGPQIWRIKKWQKH